MTTGYKNDRWQAIRARVAAWVMRPDVRLAAVWLGWCAWAVVAMGLAVILR